MLLTLIEKCVWKAQNIHQSTTLFNFRVEILTSVCISWCLLVSKCEFSYNYDIFFTDTWWKGLLRIFLTSARCLDKRHFFIFFGVTSVGRKETQVCGLRGISILFLSSGFLFWTTSIIYTTLFRKEHRHFLRHIVCWHSSLWCKTWNINVSVCWLSSLASTSAPTMKSSEFCFWEEN